jgi:hypothetical protein
MPRPEILFAIAFITVVGFFVFRAVKYGGLRGALYGGRVVETFGDVEVSRYGSTRTLLRVLLLEDGRIVLEQSTRAVLAVSLSGFPMVPSEADQLIQFLQQARASAQFEGTTRSIKKPQ